MVRWWKSSILEENSYFGQSYKLQSIGKAVTIYDIIQPSDAPHLVRFWNTFRRDPEKQRKVETPGPLSWFKVLWGLVSCIESKV